MRILLVSANFRPSVGGIERFVEILAAGLAERGHEVTVAACRTQGAPLRERADRVEIVRIPASDVVRTRLDVPYPLPAPRAAIRTLRTLLAQADVVHVQDALYVTSVASLVLAERLGIPSVLTQHVSFVPQENVALDLAQRGANRTLGQVARLADVVAAYNPSVAEWARRTWGLRDVRMLPTGVLEPDDLAHTRADTRRALGLPEDAFVALFTGRDVPKKRLEVFLGAGDSSYDLVAVTDRADNGSSPAHIVPFMEPDRYARVLAASDAFVLPSVGEGFPLALQEALVAGLPCVLTREPGYERFLSEGDVVFVEPDASAVREALRRIASDPRYRAKLAARGKAVGKREFGVHRFVGGYEDLYAEVRVPQR